MYDSQFSLREEFAAVEREARANAVGVWDYSGPDEDSNPENETAHEYEDVEVSPVPSDGDYTCGDFDRQQQAQAVLDGEEGDPHGLDCDGDGVAC